MNRFPIEIRRATISDIPTLVEYNKAMALETEGKNLDKKILAAGVKNLFKNPEFGFYLVAEMDIKIVGQLMITYEWSDWRNGMFWWIQSVYVNPESRGQGIYKRLYQSVLELAREKENVCGIRLYVDKTNLSAKKVYGACGMAEAHYDMYEVDFVLK